MSWVDEVASSIAEMRTPLERMYDVWMPGWDAIPGPRFRLWATTGQPLVCCICDRFDGWQPDDEDGRIWVCEHTPIPGVPIRHMDTAVFADIGHMELVSSPMEEYYGQA